VGFGLFLTIDERWRVRGVRYSFLSFPVVSKSGIVKAFVVPSVCAGAGDISRGFL